MANYTPPIDGDEMVMVHLVRAWGSSGNIPFRMYRLTRAGLEALDAMIIQEGSVHERSMPSLTAYSDDDLPTPEGFSDSVPEGSYVVRLATATSESQSVTLTWLPNGVELEGRAINRKLDSEPVGLISAVSGDFNGRHQYLNMGDRGYLWLTPIRHMARLLRENSRPANLTRPPLASTGNNNDWLHSRVKTLCVDPSKADPGLIDNKFADGTALEDWLLFDCDALSFIKAAG